MKRLFLWLFTWLIVWPLKRLTKWLYFGGKQRTRIREFLAPDMKIKLMRVRLSRKNYAYEVDFLVKKKFLWEKVGKFRLSDADLIIRLIKEAEAYVKKA